MVFNLFTQTSWYWPVGQLLKILEVDDCFLQEHSLNLGFEKKIHEWNLTQTWQLIGLHCRSRIATNSAIDKPHMIRIYDIITAIQRNK